MKELTSTSYALLGLLAVRPWSAYDLTGQMNRGFRLIWPRAESAIYAEPKNLVAHGLAKATKEPAGPRRKRTVYSITPKGKKAFQEWLAQPSAPPQFESEAHLRTMFGELAAKEDALRTLRGYAVFGEELRATLVAQLQGYLDDDGPFPERWHLIGLGSRFLLEYALLSERWANWAAQHVEHWPSMAPDDARKRGEKLLRQSLERFAEPDTRGL